MRILLELDKGVWLACSPAIAFFVVMLIANIWQQISLNRKPRR